MRIALKAVTGKVKARVARLQTIQGQIDNVGGNGWALTTGGYQVVFILILLRSGVKPTRKQAKLKPGLPVCRQSRVK